MDLQSKYASSYTIISQYRQLLEQYIEDVNNAISLNEEQQKEIHNFLDKKKDPPKKIRGSIFTDIEFDTPPRKHDQPRQLQRPKPVKWKPEEEQTLISLVNNYGIQKSMTNLLHKLQITSQEPTNLDPAHPQSMSSIPSLLAEHSQNLHYITTHKERLTRLEELLASQKALPSSPITQRNISLLEEEISSITPRVQVLTNQAISAQSVSAQIAQAAQNPTISPLGLHEWRCVASSLRRHTIADCRQHYEYLTTTRKITDAERAEIETISKSGNDVGYNLLWFADQHELPPSDVISCYTNVSKSSTAGSFSIEEDAALKGAVKTCGTKDWTLIAEKIPGRTPQQCLHRYEKCLVEKKMGRWSKEEQKRLFICFRLFPGQWKKIAEFCQGRLDTQIRDHITNSSLNGIKIRSAWSKDEDILLFKLASQKEFIDPKTTRPRWSKIAGQITGRTDGQCAKRYQRLVKSNKITNGTFDATNENVNKESFMSYNDLWKIVAMCAALVVMYFINVFNKKLVNKFTNTLSSNTPTLRLGIVGDVIGSEERARSIIESAVKKFKAISKDKAQLQLVVKTPSKRGVLKIVKSIAEKEQVSILGIHFIPGVVDNRKDAEKLSNEITVRNWKKIGDESATFLKNIDQLLLLIASTNDQASIGEYNDYTGPKVRYDLLNNDYMRPTHSSDSK
ncbi:hypothetical protein QTN25_002664 [Entamoeba marina]